MGLAGSIVGGILVIGGNLLLNWLQHRKEKALNEARKRLLEEMLKASDWRKLSALFRVVGAVLRKNSMVGIDPSFECSVFAVCTRYFTCGWRITKSCGDRRLV